MADEPAAPPKTKNSTVVTLMIVLIVAGIEAAAFFVAMKYLGGGPSPSFGASGEHVMEGDGEGAGEDGADSGEVVLLERFRVPNDKSGSTIIYDFDISVVVPAERRAEMEEVIATRASEIRDRAAQTIRQASKRVLDEDDFGTLRMLLKLALSEIVGDDEMIKKVLIPRCVPMRTD